jgi:uracil-DNA glycosylase
LIQVPPDGPLTARIMLVGEAPGEQEERELRPFVGASGQELNRMLQEAGIGRSECFVTNVCRVRPPNNEINAFIAKTKKEITSAHVSVKGRWVLPVVASGVELLCKEIAMVRPEVIVAFGNTPLWALAGLSGITKWRGSMLYTDAGGTRTKLIPTIHPAGVLRQWDTRATVVNDLRRVARFRNGQDYPAPDWRFRISPSFDEVIAVLKELYSRMQLGENLRLSFDLETRAGHIACAGISWTLLDAICIPFMQRGKPEGYWSEEEETQIVWWLAKVLTHQNAAVIGQNALYDCQYTYRHWLFTPQIVQDCMISQHTIFSSQPKSLAYQASMYCNFYQFWKEEGKNI